VYFAVAKLGDKPTDGKTDVNPEGLTAGETHTGNSDSRGGTAAETARLVQLLDQLGRHGRHWLS